MKYGYCRVSSTGQSYEAQVEKLIKYGVAEDCIRAEKVSGKSLEGRNELNTLMSFLRDGDTLVSITSSVSVTFSESMDTSSVTTNTLDTSCFGTFQVSSDGFTTCVQMSSSPTSSNSDKTFII